MTYIETELYKILGSGLRVARDASGLTLQEVSKKFNTTPMTIQRYEKGDRKITVEKIRLLCDLYQVDANELMQNCIEEWKNISSQPNKLFDLTEPEQQLLRSYRQLNLEGQAKAVEYVNDLVATGRYIKSNSDGLLEAK